jgi:hypothetical protein
MRIKLLVAALVTAALIITGYATMKPKQSSFYSNFSLHELVHKNKTRAGQICSSGPAGGGGLGASFTGGGSVHNRKGDSFRCRIKSDDSGQFNESELITSLKEDVEKEIQTSGAKIVDGGNVGVGGFYFEYSLGDIRGRIDISGKKIREDSFDLKAELEEKGKE